MQSNKSEKLKRPERWYAKHVGKNGCNDEAFGYAYRKGHPKFRKFIGAYCYKRGTKVTQISEDTIKNGEVYCQTCKKPIVGEDQIEPTMELFTVKSLLRMVDILDKFYSALKANAHSHISLIEYGEWFNVDYETWKVGQDALDRNTTNIFKMFETLYGTCAGLGFCEGNKPSEIILASMQQGLSPNAGGASPIDLMHKIIKDGGI